MLTFNPDNNQVHVESLVQGCSIPIANAVDI